MCVWGGEGGLGQEFPAHKPATTTANRNKYQKKERDTYAKVIGNTHEPFKEKTVNLTLKASLSYLKLTAVLSLSLSLSSNLPLSSLFFSLILLCFS